MSTNGDRQDWSDDQQLTAYAFGELEGAELAEFEARIAGDEEAQALVAELQGLGTELEQELAGEAQPGLSKEQRAALSERLQATTQPKAKARWTHIGATGWVAIAAGFVGLCVGGYEFFWSGQGAEDYRLASSNAPGSGPVARGSRFDWDGQRAAGKSGELKSLNATGYIATEPSLNGLESLGYTDSAQGEAPVRYRGPGDTGPPAPAKRTQKEELQIQALRSLGYDGSEAAARLKDLGYVALEKDALHALGYVDESGPGPEPGRSLPNRDSYERIYENPFHRVSEAPRSTFSVDVDTASYANVRRFLEGGSLPPADAVRIEELINYFPYAYAEPTGPHPFAVHTEVGSAPWAPAHRLVRIGLQAKRTLPSERPGSNLVFLLDVSGSMSSDDKLPLLKKALHMLVQQLDERDTISIVVYAGASGLALPPTRCDLGVNIHMALERLNAGGSTNGGAGIELAYQVAKQNFIQGGINRVILGTDGDFNVGVSSNGDLTRLIEAKAKSGVFLSVLGFGRGNLQDSKMEQLADKGNGNYAYIDSVLEARKVLVEQMGSTLETVAKDVKLQVEFNPLAVQAYRLLGYENRMLATRDFNDDTKDAGEIGAGHSVTALYEVVPVGVPMQLPDMSPSRYQQPLQAGDHAFSGELMNLALRYKQPAADTSVLLSTPIQDSTANFHELSADTRWAATVAAFGMLLRKSKHAGTAELGELIQWAAQGLGEDPGGYRAQFIGLAGKARQLMKK